MDGLQKWKQSVYDALDWCDVAVFQRNTHQTSLDLMIEGKRRGKLVIGEHDDNYIDIPDHNNGAKYYRQQRPVIEQMLKVAHGHTVTTKGLRDFYSTYNKNIQIIPNAWDVDVYDVTPPLSSLYIFNGKNQQISVEQFQNIRDGKKFVCWAGSPTHEKDLEVVIKPLKKLIERENVIVGMCAFVHRQMMQLYPSDKLFLFGLVPAMVTSQLQQEIFFLSHESLQPKFHSHLSLVPMVSDTIISLVNSLISSPLMVDLLVLAMLLVFRQASMDKSSP
jgi:glycosyltransferase involved in cell wall biosynthesis